MSKITPGKWTVENRMTCGEGWAVLSDHDFPNSNGTTHRQYVAQIVGNPETARAISAVPDMMEALESVLIGGNHLGLVIGADHPPHTATHEDAQRHYGAGDKYEVWCCWRAIMNARAALAKARGETP